MADTSDEDKTREKGRQLDMWRRDKPSPSHEGCLCAPGRHFQTTVGLTMYQFVRYLSWTVTLHPRSKMPPSMVDSQLLRPVRHVDIFKQLVTLALVFKKKANTSVLLCYVKRKSGSLENSPRPSSRR